MGHHLGAVRVEDEQLVIARLCVERVNGNGDGGHAGDGDGPLAVVVIPIVVGVVG